MGRNPRFRTKPRMSSEHYMGHVTSLSVNHVPRKTGERYGLEKSQNETTSIGKLCAGLSPVTVGNADFLYSLPQAPSPADASLF